MRSASQTIPSSSLRACSSSSTSTSSSSSSSSRAARSTLKVSAMAQLRQIVRSTPNRGAIVYTMGKELFLVLRCLPLGILNKVTPTNFNPSSSSSSSSSSLDGAVKTHNSHNQDNANPISSTSSSAIPGPSPAISSESTAITTDNTNIFTDFFGKATFSAISMKLQNTLRRAESTTTVGNIHDMNLMTSSANNLKELAISSTPPSSPAPARKYKADILPSKPLMAPLMDPWVEPEMATEWKNIEARTRYLVLKMASAVNDENAVNIIHYIEDLYNHIAQYRESRIVAVESGAIKSLAKILRVHRDHTPLVHCARETLGLLGYNAPLKGFGIKVLSIDGGGVRGLVAIEVLRMIEKQTGQRIHELFDYICGVSTGSILAFLIGVHRRTLDECEGLYKQLSREIFNQNSLIGAGSLFWSHSYYNTAAWEKILRKHVGEHDLMAQARDADLPRVAAISTIVNHERVTPYVFRTYAFEPGSRSCYSGDSRHKMWEAVRASAAAPTYFEEIKLGNTLHQDGGVLVNNPTSVALSEAKMIWQGAPLQTVLSLGTGQTFSSRRDPNLSDLSNPPTSKSPNSLSWKGKFLKVLDSATDTESVHHTLMELLPKNVYFRFNPHLHEMLSMDEVRPERLEQVQKETGEYLVRNIDKVNFCCEMLTRQKGFPKKVYDWWNFQG